MPVQPQWDPQARAILDAIAGELPFLFRAAARSAAVDRAHKMAWAAQQAIITRDDAIIAMILIAPDDWRDAFKKLLRKHRVDVEKFRKYFEKH